MPLRRQYLFFFIALYCSLFSSTLLAQKPSDFTSKHFLFIDHKNQTPVLILNDSTMFKGYDFKKSVLINYPKDISFSDLLSTGKNEQTYFIDKGCGPVYIFKDSMFERIDKTFRHRNQYNSSLFIYDDIINLFGGYGMFTEKNIITYYDENIGEWLERPIVSSIKPSPRSSANSILIDDSFYLWDGSVKDDIIYAKEIEENILWKLDLKLNRWENYGSTKKNLLLNRNASFKIQESNILYIISYDVIYKYDVINNVLEQFEFNQPNLVDCVYDPFSNKVILVIKNIENDAKNIFISSINDLINKPVLKEKMYNNKSSNYYWYLSIPIFFLLLFISKQLSANFRKSKSIVYNFSQSKLKYNDKSLILENDLKELFELLVDHQKEYILLDDLNEIFLNNEINESYITINKRRDSAVKKLIFILSTFLNKDENDILLERKNTKDKRVKEVKLGIKIIT